MLDPAQETARLKDLLPASWRMRTTIKPSLVPYQVITSSALPPWRNPLKVEINFALWSELALVERDLLFLREVSFDHQRNWLKFGVFQSLFILSLVGSLLQFNQGDLTGTAIALGLGSVSAWQVWRQTQGVAVQLSADWEAIQVAERRGYTQTTAAQALLASMARVAEIEGRTTPDFVELIRSQQLKVLAGLSDISIPSEVTAEY
ncbi:MAG: DUF3318 domain-containing protein [Pseudanabaenaceae cyanobacterium]